MTEVPQIRARSRTTVRPTTMDRTTTSRAVKRRRRPRRTGVVRRAVASTVGTGGATTRPTLRNRVSEDALLLSFNVRAERVNVRRAVLVDKALNGRDHNGLGEVRPGVPVEVLRDVLRLLGRRDRLLLHAGVPAGVGTGVDRHVARVGLQVRVLRVRRAEVLG